MTIDIAAALRRATDTTRALDVAEATRHIQEALGIRRADAETTGPQARRAEAEIEDAEIVAPPRRPGRSARRRPLAEVVSTLRDGRAATAELRGLRGLRPAPHVPVPEGARFEARHHAARPAPATSASTSPPRRPGPAPAASSSCCTAAPRRPRTSPPAPA